MNFGHSHGFDADPAAGPCSVARAQCMAGVAQLASQTLKAARKSRHVDPDAVVRLEFTLPAIRRFMPEALDIAWAPEDRPPTSQDNHKAPSCVAGLLLVGTAKWLAGVVVMHEPYSLVNPALIAVQPAAEGARRPFLLHLPAREAMLECYLSASYELGRRRRGRHILLAGFGCAGAVAQLLALQYASCLHEALGQLPVREVYSFGAPRVGCSEFERSLVWAGIRHLRVVCGGDGRPLLPLQPEPEAEPKPAPAPQSPTGRDSDTDRRRRRQRRRRSRASPTSSAEPLTEPLTKQPQPKKMRWLQQAGELCYLPADTNAARLAVRRPWLAAGCSGSLDGLPGVTPPLLIDRLQQAAQSTWRDIAQFVREGLSIGPPIATCTPLATYVALLGRPGRRDPRHLTGLPPRPRPHSV
jgi:hypothetical protein